MVTPAFAHLDTREPPSAYEEVSREGILNTFSRLLQVQVPGIDLSLPSVGSRLSDVHSGYAHALLEHSNVRIRSQLLRYATGVDLDHIGAWYGDAGRRHEGELDDAYRIRLYTVPFEGNTATEAGVRSALIAAFSAQVGSVGFDIDYSKSLANVYATRPYEVVDDVSKIAQSAAQRGAFLAYLQRDDVQMIGQRYAVNAERIIPFVMQANVSYNPNAVSEQEFRTRITTAWDNYMRIYFGYNEYIINAIRETSWGFHIREAHIRRALTVEDADIVDIKALHKVGGSGVQDLIATSEPRGSVFFGLRGEDISASNPNGVSITLSGGSVI